MNQHVYQPKLGDIALQAVLALAAQPADASVPAPCTAGMALAAARRARRKPGPDDQALVRLADRLACSDTELLALALLAQVETDPDACRTIAACQTPVGGARPLLGLLASAFSEPGATARVLLQLSSGAAVRHGVLRLGSEDAPLPERSASLAQPILMAINGIDICPDEWQLRVSAVCPTGEGHGVSQLGPWLAAAPQGFAVSGCPKDERTDFAWAMAARFGLKPAWKTSDAEAVTGAWLVAAGAMPVMEADLRSGEWRNLPDFGCYDGPWLWFKGRDGVVMTATGAAQCFPISAPSVGERRRLWEGHGFGSAEAVALARGLRVGAGSIARIAAAAPPEAKTAQDVIARFSGAAHPGLDGLAERVTGQVPDEGFVVSPDLLRELQHLVDHCRLREDLMDGHGPAARIRQGAGVKALLHGPSGTGKSLAAQWLATRIGAPLYRVDLAAVTSKWIGETEKNIGQLLGAAQEANALLLFDEADSLFGARTDIAGANDKFANSQTNYLLQRLEAHDGIVVLTTNSRERMDSAFTRRLDSIIAFPLPEPEARLGIWQAHMGNRHDLSETELQRLAAYIDLSGGHIRNIVVGAVVESAALTMRPGYGHVLSAAGREYAKLGRSLPRELG
jgi:ATPase family associated with various cellular activities (AAA)